MRRISDLLFETDADPVPIDADGSRLEATVPEGLGPATLLVGPVVDAVKLVEDGRVVGSLDRDDLYAVAGVVVARSLLESIAETELSLPAIIEAAAMLGHRWESHPWEGSAGG